MTNNISLLNNHTNQSSLDSSDQNISSFLIPVGLVAIAALTEIGFYIHENYSNYIYKQTFAPLAENSIAPSLSKSANKQGVEILLKKAEKAASANLSSEPIEQIEFSSLFEEADESDAPSLKGSELTYEEAKEKYIQATKEHKQMSSRIKDLEKKLKNTPKNDASKTVLSAELKECKQQLGTLHKNIQNAYRVRTEAFALRYKTNS